MVSVFSVTDTDTMPASDHAPPDLTASYEAFLRTKAATAPPVGIPDPPELTASLFPFQRDLTRWALRRGRAALFADTGLGKTRMQLVWADVVTRHTGRPTIILAPLAVSGQTVREGADIGVEVTHCREPGDLRPGINITNYQRLDKFADRIHEFGAVVLDESSILKDFTGATRTMLIETFRETPFRLACTATPAPNDFTELGNHAEFLGVLTRTEMLATWFVHDGGTTRDWRVKGHATDSFWRWVTSWGAMVKRPSDLGYTDDGYNLPPLDMIDIVCASDIETAKRAGQLFVVPASTLQEQRTARRASLPDRVSECARIVNASTGPFLVWCELNDEGNALEKAIAGAVQIAGSDSAEDKESRMLDFAAGRIRVLVTKGSIAGYGMNWQHCAQQAFVGISHEWEKFYQQVRRSWRFGQRSTVTCYIITSEAEGAVGANLQRKEADAAKMATEMAKYTRALTAASVRASGREVMAYEPREAMRVPMWLMDQSEARTGEVTR